MTTITMWIPKSDLENFTFLNNILSRNSLMEQDIMRVNKYYPITIYTEPRHVETLQLNVSLDLFVKLNLK